MTSHNITPAQGIIEARNIKAGLVTAETYAPKLDNKLAQLRAAARNKPIERKATTGGSKDGLWTTNIGDKK